MLKKSPHPIDGALNGHYMHANKIPVLFDGYAVCKNEFSVGALDYFK